MVGKILAAPSVADIRALFGNKLWKKILPNKKVTGFAPDKLCHHQQAKGAHFKSPETLKADLKSKNAQLELTIVVASFVSSAIMIGFRIPRKFQMSEDTQVNFLLLQLIRVLRKSCSEALQKLCRENFQLYLRHKKPRSYEIRLLAPKQKAQLNPQ